MTPLESIERVGELNEWAFERARAGLREQDSAATEQEIELRLAALKYGAEIVFKATGWDPEDLVG